MVANKKTTTTTIVIAAARKGCYGLRAVEGVARATEQLRCSGPTRGFGRGFVPDVAPDTGRVFWNTPAAPTRWSAPAPPPTPISPPPIYTWPQASGAELDACVQREARERRAKKMRGGFLIPKIVITPPPKERRREVRLPVEVVGTVPAYWRREAEENRQEKEAEELRLWEEKVLLRTMARSAARAEGWKLVSSNLKTLRKEQRKAQREGRQARLEGRFEDKELWEQISWLSMRCAANKNPFAKLRVDVPEIIPKRKSSPPASWKKEVHYVNCGPRTNKAWSYIEKRLAHKRLIATLQSEWWEARFLRREKMRRVVTVSNHRVQTLHSQLQRLAEPLAKENFFSKEDRKEQSEYSKYRSLGEPLVPEFKIYNPKPEANGNPPSFKMDSSEFNADAIFKIGEENMVYDPDWDCLLDEYIPTKKELDDCTIFHQDEYFEGRIAEAQMDVGEDAHGDNTVAIEKNSNVETHLQEATEVASALPTSDTQNVYTELSASATNFETSEVVERFLTIDSFEWKPTHTQQQNIYSMDLPKDILDNPIFQNSPNSLPFSTHMYWSGDMKVKFILNCNCRIMGQLQISFYYGAHQDENFNECRDNIWIASQRLHSLMTANFGDAVEIEIPFEYIMPILTINRVVNTQDTRSLGVLKVKVLVPLQAAVNCEPVANVQVGILFCNSKFQGMVGRNLAAHPLTTDLVSADMLPAMATIVAVKSLLDRNRDRPTITTAGLPVIPINSSSWCYGTNQPDYCNILRLDPTQVLPYEIGRIPAVDEMTIEHCVRTYGLIDIFKIDANKGNRSRLASYNATPLDDVTKYPSVSVHGEQCYCLPPVSIVSSMFAYWRGSLELRLDIVASTEISFSIVIAYIPRYFKEDEITFQQAMTCPHTIFDIHQNRQIVYKIPFLASHMFYPRRTNLSTEFPVLLPPGSVHIYMYNRPSFNCSIPNEIQILTYIRAGEDFEVGVPCAPSIGLSFNPKILHPTTLTHRWIFKQGYFPTYISTWRYNQPVDSDAVLETLCARLGDEWVSNIEIVKGCYKSSSARYPIFRYGGVSDHISQFRPINYDDSYLSGRNYCVKITTELIKNNLQILVKRKTTSGFTTQVQNLKITHMLISKRIDSKYWYGFPLSTNQAKNFNTLMGGQYTQDAFPSTIWLVTLFKNDVSFANTVLISFYDTDYFEPYEFIAEALYPPYTPAQAEAGTQDNNKAAISEPQSTAKPNAARAVWGEQFLDFKDLARRYQLFASDSILVKQIVDTTHWRTISIRVPIMPQGLNLDIGQQNYPNEYWNRTRDGHIPIIASLYRFYCGGVRFRICINIQTVDVIDKDEVYRDLTGKVFVQHRPNVTNGVYRVTIQQGSDLGNDDLEQPTYAGYHQFDIINNVLSVEVPFYLPSIRAYLQRPSSLNLAKLYSTLGELAIGVTIFDYKNLKLTYDIYYSIADDTRFSVFVGAPPIIDNSNIAPVDPALKFSRKSVTQILTEQTETINEINDSKDEFDIAYFDAALKLETCNQLAALEKIKEAYSKGRVSKENSIDKISKLLKKCGKAGDQKAEANMVFGGLFSSTTTKLEETSDVMKEAILETKADIKETAENLNSITSKIKSCFENITPTLDGIKFKFYKYLDLIINAITNITHCLLNLSIKHIAVAIMSFLTQLKVVTWQASSDIASKLKDIMDWMFANTTVTKDCEVVLKQPILEGVQSVSTVVPAEGQMDADQQKEKDNLLCSYISTIIAGVASLFNFTVTFSKNRYNDLSSLLLSGLSKFAFTANQMFTFVKNNLLMIKKAGEWMFGDHPSVKALGILKDKHEDIYKWACRVQEITNPMKENKVFTCIRLSNEVYELSAIADLVNIKILALGFDRAQTITLHKLIDKIHSLRDRLSKTHTAPPVRFEPFVIEFTGKTNIGKSRILNDIPHKLFKALNMKHEGELIYHRQTGNQFWSNLRNQPVLVVDEKFPVRMQGFLDVQLMELFQIKSCGVFNPPMADLADKNIRYNPLLVLYGSNSAYPPIKTEAINVEAVYRRRDLLIHVQMKESIRNKHGVDAQFKDCSKEELGDVDNHAHLEFIVYDDVVKEKDLSQNTRVVDGRKVHNFDQIFDYICKTFLKYYHNELSNYRKAIAKLNELMPNEDEPAEIDKIFSENWFNECVERLDAERAPKESTYRKNYNYVLHNVKDSARQTKGFEAILTDYNKGNNDEWHKFMEEQTRLAVPVLETPKAGGSATQPKQLASADMPNHFFMCEHEYFEAALFVKSLKDYVEYDVDLDAYTIRLTTKSIEWLNSAFAIKNNQTLDDAEAAKEYKEIYDCFKYKDDKLIIPLKTCRLHCDVTKDVDKRKLLTKAYLDFRPDLKVKFLSGKSILGEVPNEYLNIPEVKDVPTQIAEHKEIEEKLPEIKTWFQSLKEKFYKIEWRKWLKRLGIAIFVISMFGVLAGLWNWCTTGQTPDTGSLTSIAGLGLGSACKMEEIVKAEGHVSGDHKTLKHSSKLTAPVVKGLKEATSAAAQMNVRNKDSILRKLRRNTCFLSVDNMNFTQIGRCLGICGRYILCLQHYWEAWENTCRRIGEDKITFSAACDKRLSSIVLNFSELKHIAFEGNSSICLIELPKRIPLFLDIRSLIATQNQHMNSNRKGCIYELNLDQYSELIEPTVWQVKFEPYSNLEVSGRQLWKPFKVHDCYTYEGFSGAGKCGSLLLGEGLEAPIMGMHIAGFPKSTTGFSEAITRELFSSLNNQDIIQPVHADAEGFVSEFFVDSQVIGIGKVDAQFAHRERGQSRIIKSEVQLIDKEQNFKVYTQPAVLSKKDARIRDTPFSPMIKGCEHHGHPLIPFNQKDLEDAIEDVKMMILANCHPQRANVGMLSVDQAIGGIPEKENYEHIKFDTSEGFPFVGIRPSGHKNKRWLFNFDENNKYVSAHPILTQMLNHKWQERLENKIPFTVFTDCLKDTTIDTEKVLQPGKTRIFSMSPVDFTIHQRMCTLDFSAAYMHCRHKLEHMIGCNPDSYEWTVLAYNLLQNGRTAIMTGDYSKYGDSIPFEFIEAAFQIIAAWYAHNGCQDKELFQQLKIFPYEIGHAVHLMINHLYRCVCGQPSGNSLTVIINSIANSLYLRVAWLHIMRHTAYSSLADFHRLVCVYSYGDDLIVALDDLIKDIFNAKSISSFFAMHGLKFTNANKAEEIVPYVGLLEADFLKRSFLPHPTRKHPQMMLAPLEIPSIEDTPMWVWSESFGKSDPDCRSFRELSIQVCEDSTRNAFGRGPEYYKQWVTKLQQFWLTRGEKFTVDTWDKLDHKIFELNLCMSPYFKNTTYSTIDTDITT